MNEHWRRAVEYGMPGSRESRERRLEGMHAELSRQQCEREEELERSRIAGEEYDRRWKERFAAMCLEEEVEIPVTISHRDGRQEQTTVRCMPSAARTRFRPS